MDVLSSELQATCSSLGTWDGKKYLKEPDALECIKDLIRYLRRDDGEHEIRRTLGSIGVFSSDIIYILREFPDDEDLFDASLRLSVSLTSPELILFREELPEEKKTRNCYLELTNYRTHYKESLRDLPLWTVLGNKLLKLLRSPQRSEDQDLLFERILIFIRNVLQTPDKLPHVHDEIIWALHKAGIADLILFVASSDDQITYCLHVLEIISLIFRDQEPESLVKASLDDKFEKEANAQALIEATKKEIIANKSKVKPSRHSRFGGTFVVKNVSSISGESLIYHKSIQKSKNMSFDEEKRPKRKSTKFIADASKFNASSSSSSLSVKLFLKEFSIEFLNAAYNVLMQTVRDLLNREKAQQNDDSYYLWALRFFMKFNRLYKFRPELVTETLNKGIFHYVHQLIEHYKEFMNHEKKNPPKFKIWSKRLHLGIIAYQELLCYLVFMQNSKDPAIKKSGEILTHNVFYESEYRDLCLSLLITYSSERMSISYLTDLVETTHVYIKIIEHMCKSKKVIIKTKKKKAKTGRKQKPSHSNGGDKNLSVPKRIELWTEMNSKVAELIVGPQENLPTEIPVLYDPISDESMDQQRKKAIYLIQKKILEKDPGTAISILRASRDIWPENDIFGSVDVEPEDEAIILKDILITEIDDVGLESSEVPNTGYEEDMEVGNEEDEMEEEEVEEVRFSESELNFKDFMREFINKNVCLPYSVLLDNFKKNSSHTNHCVLKMFHRIAFDHKMSAMLFHISIFESFRRIWREYEECRICEKENGAPVDKTLKELVRFAKYVFQQFTSAATNNSKIYMELCFWKNVREAIEVVEGYGTQMDSDKVKASYWSEEDEETLIRVFHQFKSMEEDKPDDVLDSITMFFSESGKSRRQVARKLKNLGLIQNTKEITRKPIVNRSNEWSEEDIDDLRELFIEFENAVDPISRIKERLKGKKSKGKIISKILELELCKDPEKFKKQGKSRALSRKKGVSQDSDSLGDSSSDDDPDEICLSLSEWESRFKDNLMSLVDKGFTEHLNWIADCLTEEAEDKDDDDDEEESVPLIAMNELQGKALESPDFQSFLRDLNFQSPNAILQEKYWRINGRPKSLQSRASLIKEGLQTEFVNYSTLIPVFKKIKQPKTKKTWLPMKRGEIDEEAMERINNLFKSKNVESTPDEVSTNTSSKSSKEVKKRRKKKSPSAKESTRNEKSSSDSDDSSNVVNHAEKLKAKKRVDTRGSSRDSSSNDSSSSSSEDQEKTHHYLSKEKLNSDTESSSDSDEEKTQERSSKTKPDSDSGSSSESEKEKTEQRSPKRKPDIDSESSSDEEQERIKPFHKRLKSKTISSMGSSSSNSENESIEKKTEQKYSSDDDEEEEEVQSIISNHHKKRTMLLSDESD